MIRKFDDYLGKTREDDSQLPHGSMWNDNTNTTVTISGTDTPVEVGSNMSAGDTYLMTFQNAKELVCNFDGHYLITWSLSVECASANIEVEGGIMINGVASTQGDAHSNLMTANRPMTFSGSAILNLTVGNTVSLFLQNHTSATNLVVNHASLSAVRVGI